VKRLIDETEIRAAVIELGRQISADYRRRPLTALGVVTGSIVLLADLIRVIDLPLRVGLIQASSYRGATTAAGELSIGTDLLPDVTDRDVLLVDDIFDSGRTLATLCGILREKQASSVRTAVLLWKDRPTDVDLQPDYYCFKIPDVFVVGYGLDYDGEYRHLPYIAELEEADR